MIVKKGVQAAFFFGSGISRPSGMPLVEQITEAVLGGKWHHRTSGSFWPGDNPNPMIPDNITPAVQKLLRFVSDYAAKLISRLKKDGSTEVRAPHYEDFYSLLEQTFRVDFDHAPNLAVVDFAQRLRREFDHLHANLSHDDPTALGFEELLETSCDYLHWVVYHQLTSDNRDRRGLELISETAKAVDTLDIFTLNHDLLIESQLRADGVQGLATGFEGTVEGSLIPYQYRWWTKFGGNLVRLFKLHGSINWWAFEKLDGTQTYARVKGDPYHATDSEGNLLRPSDWKPAFLSGSIVKKRRYGGGIWLDQFAGFYSKLAEHRNLICCGYGFGDTGVNTRLAHWLSEHSDNKLIILDPEADVFKDKPFWIQRAHQSGRLHVVPKYLQSCRLADIEHCFSLDNR